MDLEMPSLDERCFQVTRQKTCLQMGPIGRQSNHTTLSPSHVPKPEGEGLEQEPYHTLFNEEEVAPQKEISVLWDLEMECSTSPKEK